LAEQVTLNHWVVGSIPTRCSLFKVLKYSKLYLLKSDGCSRKIY
jgi:hypothetical protein